MWGMRLLVPCLSPHFKVSCRSLQLTSAWYKGEQRADPLTRRRGVESMICTFSRTGSGRSGTPYAFSKRMTMKQFGLSPSPHLAIIFQTLEKHASMNFINLMSARTLVNCEKQIQTRSGNEIATTGNTTTQTKAATTTESSYSNSRNNDEKHHIHDNDNKDT